jgi:hypothetical protein
MRRVKALHLVENGTLHRSEESAVGHGVHCGEQEEGGDGEEKHGPGDESEEHDE